MNSLITPKFPSAPISYKSLLFSSLGTNNLCHFFPQNLSVFLISTITHKIPFLEHFSSFLTGFVVSALTTGNLFSPQWSQPFWHQGPVSWKIIFPRTRGEEWFWDDWSALHLLYTLFLLLLDQLHLRSSGIRSCVYGYTVTIMFQY